MREPHREACAGEQNLPQLADTVTEHLTDHRIIPLYL